MIDIAALWTASSQQKLFRQILNAMSRPGQIECLAEEHHSNAYVAVMASLVDGSVTLAAPDSLISEQDRLMLQAQRGEITQADFIICSGDQFELFQPRLGSITEPELSATLIFTVDSLSHGKLHLEMTGPGINGTTACSIAGLDQQWLQQRAAWVAEFPMGVDMLFVDDKQLMAIPRTTQVRIK